MDDLDNLCTPSLPRLFFDLSVKESAHHTAMLTLPFRRSEPATLSAAVRTYIDSKYGQHPDMFRHDLEAIDRLRHDAIHVQEPHNSGIRKLMAYAAQLVWIGGKFPIDVCAAPLHILLLYCHCSF